MVELCAVMLVVVPVCSLYASFCNFYSLHTSYFDASFLSKDAVVAEMVEVGLVEVGAVEAAGAVEVDAVEVEDVAVKNQTRKRERVLNASICRGIGISL